MLNLLPWDLALLSLALIPLVRSAPIFGIDLPFGDDDDSTATSTSVSPDEVDSLLVRPAQFSRVAYCSSASVTNWTCGGPCDDLGGNVRFLQAGGDEGAIPLYFVAHDSHTNTIVVAHQGTAPENFLSILNDINLFLTDINLDRFPSADGQDIQVHSGFQDTFERTADGMLTGVQQALADTGVTQVLTTGHSLGGALAMLDAMFLKDNLPPEVNISSVTFGLPRVGNQAWADFIDAGLGSSITHVTNQNDPVPHLPPSFLDYVHPSGEIHINTVDDQGEATDIVACAGQENESCADANGVDILGLDLDINLSITDHLGPYFKDISFGSFACPA